MQLVNPNNSQNLRNRTHGNSMLWILRERRMPSSVSMNNQLEILVTQRLQRRKTTSQNIHHHVFPTMIQHKLSPLQQCISLSRDVRQIHFLFPSRSFSFVPTF